MLIEGLNMKVNIDSVLRLPETIRDCGTLLQILIVSIQMPTKNNANENILFNILEYFSFLNFVPIKSPNIVQRVNDTQLFKVNIVLINIILDMF